MSGVGVSRSRSDARSAPLTRRLRLGESAARKSVRISQLTALVKTRLRRMQYRPGLPGGFLAGTRLDLTPFRNLRN